MPAKKRFIEMDRMENYQIGHTPAKGKEFKIERNVCHDAHVEVAFSHRHTFYALYWIHWGEGEHMIDFEHYAILPNRMFFVKPEQVHLLRVGSKVCYSALQFTEEFMWPFYAEKGSMVLREESGVYRDLDRSEQERMRVLFDLVSAESAGNLPDSETLLRAEIDLLMLEWKRMGRVEASRQSLPDILIRYRKLINEKFLDCRQVSEYARMLGVTPNYLNVLSQRCVGVSALSLIHRRIMLEIKRLLLRTDLDVSEIAYAMRFNELSYFSRFFKRNAGVTPNEFRRSMNKMYQK